MMTGSGQSFLDLSIYAGDEKERRMVEAMDRGTGAVLAAVSANEQRQLSPRASRPRCH
jgi:hypothetical protein